MNSNLFSRSLGTTSPQACAAGETGRLLRFLHAALNIKFDGSREGKPIRAVGRQTATDGGTRARSRPLDASEGEEKAVWAHRAGVNSLVIDKFEGRLMLSGGASSEILLWNLESKAHDGTTAHRPINRTKQGDSSGSHKFGITQVSFYAFDSGAFLSSSYDHKLNIYATETMTPSATFDLDSVVYSHAMSPIGDHVLVACATQHAAVRLVDLQSGASTHSLVGHKGGVLSVAWSPLDEYLLASAGSDGTVRFWDIRRSAGCLGVLDLEDAVGVGGEDGLGTKARQRDRGRAHMGAANGVVWTDDAKYLVTAGHDERVRVWNVATGANALSHFGQSIKNTNFSSLVPLLVPHHLNRPGERLMIYPNEKELLVFDLLEGTLIKRLRVPNPSIAQAGAVGGQRNVRNRITSLAWRMGDLECYSAHTDGVVRAWRPRTPADTELDKEDTLEADESGDESRKRKREALNDVFRDLTKQKITFT